LGDALARRNGTLEATLGFGNVSQEPHRVEKVGFPRSVWSNDEDPPPQRNIEIREILPVLEAESREHGKPTVDQLALWR
jgi:hypothetical protein